MSDGFWGGGPVPGSYEAAETPLGALEVVHEFTSGPMPTGVSVAASGRIFVNFPRWGDEVPATVVELRDGEAVPYPSAAWNTPSGDGDAGALVSVQSIVVDARERLWILDTGSPMFAPTVPGGPKLVGVALATDEVVSVITFPVEVALPTTCLNDVRLDLRRGEQGVADITDSADAGPDGLIVVDLASGESWRRLHDHPSTKALTPPEFTGVAEGRVLAKRAPDGTVQPVTMGADGIAISADGKRLWYCPLSSRRWWSVDAAALADRSVSNEDVAATVRDEGDEGGGADGLETDDAGRLHATSWEHDAILRRLPDGTMETIAHDPRMLWPDTMSVAADRHLSFTADQLHRQADHQGGEDLRVHPYRLFRLPIDAGPVRLV